MATEELYGLSYDGMRLIIIIAILVFLVILTWYFFRQQKKMKREITMIKMELRELKKKD